MLPIDVGNQPPDGSGDNGSPTVDTPTVDAAVVETAPPDGLAASTRVGLVGYWPLDEGSGQVTRDQGSLGNDGELRGDASWAKTGLFPAKFFNPACLSLHGVDGEVRPTVAGLPGIGAAKTISLWAWFAQPLPASVRKNLLAFSRYMDDAGIQFGFDSGRAAVWLRGDPELLVASPVLPAQIWYHLAYVFDGNVHQLYVDGALVDSSSRAKHDGTATGLYFGSYGGNTQHFNGLIDDIRFYDRRLDANELAALTQGR